jgi:hypothetical protein
MKINPGALIVPFRKLSADCHIDLCITISDISSTSYPLVIGITWKKQCVIKTVLDFYINKGTVYTTVDSH